MRKSNLILRKIKLSSINFSDNQFLFSYPLVFESVKESIKKIGLINPPILKNVKNKYTIVSGFKRIYALKELKVSDLNAFIVNDEYPQLKLFQLSLSENSLIREFNSIEKSIIINRLLRYVDKKVILEDYFKYLHLEPSLKLYNLYQPLIKLEDEIKLSIANNEISDRTGFYLLKFNKQDRMALYKLLKQLRPSFNKQNEIIEIVSEISIREDKKVKDVIQSEEVKKILSCKRFSTPQKLEEIRIYFKERRYPQLTVLEENFNALKKDLKLPSKMKFYPPPYFEGDLYQINLSFSKISQLNKQIDILNKVVNSGKLRKIMKD